MRVVTKRLMRTPAQAAWVESVFLTAGMPLFALRGTVGRWSQVSPSSGFHCSKSIFFPYRVPSLPSGSFRHFLEHPVDMSVRATTSGQSLLLFYLVFKHNGWLLMWHIAALEARSPLPLGPRDNLSRKERRSDKEFRHPLALQPWLFS